MTGTTLRVCDEMARPFGRGTTAVNVTAATGITHTRVIKLCDKPVRGADMADVTLFRCTQVT